MKPQDLQNIAKDIFGENVRIVLQTKSGKWYEQEYTSAFDEIKTERVYGVIVHQGTFIDFTFKTTKNEDNIIKSFINQYIANWEVKQLKVIDGELRKQTKEEVVTALKNHNRVSKYFFYTTLYGIGFFCFFMNETTFKNTYDIVANYLRKNNIPFHTEFSEARWVFRFVINKDVELHNELLTNLVIQ
jgi:hypothetical protein